MTLADDIQSMYDNTKDVYDGLALAKATMPAQKNLAGLVATIETTPVRLPDVPDLSKVLTASDFADIQAIVAAGKASEKFQIGQELLVSYDLYTMPFEIVGFEDVVSQTDGAEQTVHALNLLAKYTSEDATHWGDNGSTKYSASMLRSHITTTYQGKLDANFVACLANTKKQTYSRDGSTDVVYDKLFAPSMAQLGVTDASYNTAQQAAVEGPVFTAYQGAADAKRVKYAINVTTNVQYYWTSSLFSGSSNLFGIIHTVGKPTSGIYSNNIRAVAACNLVATN